MKWYRLAAVQGTSNGQFAMGHVYEYGKGVPQDYTEAMKWANLAAAQNQEGNANLRDILAEQMTPEQIAEAQRLAREWRAQHKK